MRPLRLGGSVRVGATHPGAPALLGVLAADCSIVRPIVVESPEALQAVVDAAAEIVPLENVRPLPPVERPGSYLAVWINDKKHGKEAERPGLGSKVVTPTKFLVCKGFDTRCDLPSEVTVPVLCAVSSTRSRTPGAFGSINPTLTPSTIMRFGRRRLRQGTYSASWIQPLSRTSSTTTRLTPLSLRPEPTCQPGDKEN